MEQNYKSFNVDCENWFFLCDNNDFWV